MVKELRKMSSKFNMGIFYYKPYPGNKIADELMAKGFKFANTLEEWSDFDYVSTKKSDWLSESQIKEIENFKFYQQLAYTKREIPILKDIAKWRVEKKLYAFPIERKLKEWIMPTPRMA
jgi:hypothetical protein